MSTLLDQWTGNVERRKCFHRPCPEGGIWGVCGEAAHWAEELRQHDPKTGVSSTRKDMTTAHLAGTAEYNLAHAIVHIQAALKPKSPKDQQFNLEHADHHVHEAQDHLSRLIDHMKAHYPPISKEFDNLDLAEEGNEGVAPV